MEREPHREGRDWRPERAARTSQEYFFIGPWMFNIDQAKAIIAERPRESVPLNVEGWAQAYGLDVLDDPHRVPLIGPGKLLNRDYAMTADLSIPLIVGYLEIGEEEFALLIDGTHRLYRAYVENIPELPAYALTPDESRAIRTER